MFVAFKNLVYGDALQIRQKVDHGLIEEYTEAVNENGAESFTPITGFSNDMVEIFVADGYHRIEAHKAANHEGIWCEIHTGGLREALLHAAGANANHGLRRTNADKRAAVRTILEDVEWSEWSDRRIAKACKVSDKLVATIRQEMAAPADVLYPASVQLAPPPVVKREKRKPVKTITIEPAGRVVRLTIYSGEEVSLEDKSVEVVAITPDWIRLKKVEGENPWE